MKKTLPIICLIQAVIIVLLLVYGYVQKSSIELCRRTAEVEKQAMEQHAEQLRQQVVELQRQLQVVASTGH